jgi:hypothetical protein
MFQSLKNLNTSYSNDDDDDDDDLVTIANQNSDSLLWDKMHIVLATWLYFT